jgi:hypothetical protein
VRFLNRARWALAGVMLCGAIAAHADPVPAVPTASADVRGLLQWVDASGDAAGRAFAVVDKKRGQLHVFHADGTLAGSTPALLGAARGDDSAPGVGLLRPEQIPPHQRTTPAGRFESRPGRNHEGERIVWVDYATAIAIHRLRPGASYAPRRTRLASGGGDDNRVSYGCIVVPEAFFDRVVRPVLGQGPGVVYVLPETVPADQVFAGLAQS